MKAIPKTLSKIKRIEDHFYSLIFYCVQDISVELSEYKGNHSKSSEDMTWKPFNPGDKWGQPWGSGWVRGQVELDPSFFGKEVFLQFDCGAVETLVQINGEYQGLFNNVVSEEGTRSNHHTLRIAKKGVASQRLEILMQIYAGHPCKGTQPNEDRERAGAAKYVKRFKQCGLCLKDEKIEKFAFDLRTVRLLSMSTSDVFVQGLAYDILGKVFEAVDQHPARLSPEERYRQIDAVQPSMDRLIYEQQPSSLAPVAHIIGHSHMDTAWLWTSEETVRKCARTFSMALNMMERYPDYKFIQSSSIHTEMMRTEFPSIFEGMKKRIAEGRWEPNGGMYVEAGGSKTS
jgi:alpha-mannosidase